MDQNSRKHRKKKVALLYLKTGGGHYSAARALAQSLNDNHGDDTDAVCFDPIPEDAPVAQMLLQDGYRFTSHRIGKLWILLYEFSKLKAVDIIWSFFVYLTIRKNVIQFIRRNAVDTIVILHFLLSRPLRWILREMDNKAPLLRIVTDPFTAHDMWFNRPEIPTVVFSKRLVEAASKRYPDIRGSLLLFPPVLGKKFAAVPSADEIVRLRNRFGFTDSKKCILFAGGGEGFPKGLRYISKLLTTGTDSHIILVCGKDETLKTRAEVLRRSFPAASFTVYGFVDFMAELMQTADIVVTKGGPATIMEALTCGKPVIVIQYLYGQERGNMEYVARNRFGFFASSPRAMVTRLDRFFTDADLYSSYVQRIMSNPPKNGTDEIAAYIKSFK